MDSAWKEGSHDPEAWLVQPDGMAKYNTWRDSQSTTSHSGGYGAQIEGISAPHAEALMQDIEANSQLGMGSMEFAGDLSGREANLDLFPYSTSTLPTTEPSSAAEAAMADSKPTLQQHQPPSRYTPTDLDPAGHLPSTDATSLPHQLVILGIPQEGLRTRVETQINISFALLQPRTWSASHINPADLVTAEGDLSQVAHQHFQLAKTWSYLKLPAFAAIKRNHKKHVKDDASEENTVTLDAKVIKSDSDEQVLICNSCQERERKRAQRKKDPKGKAEALEDDPNGERISQNDRRRIILFNCGQHVDFSDGQATFPARIACYCRHHREREGFRIASSICTSQGEVLAETVSRTVFTTDDHKARPRTSEATSVRNVEQDVKPQTTALEPQPVASAPTQTNNGTTESSLQPVAGPSNFEQPPTSFPSARSVGKCSSSGGKARQQLRADKPYNTTQRPKRHHQSGGGEPSRSQSHLSMTPLTTPHQSAQTSPAVSPRSSGPWDPWSPSAATSASHFEGNGGVGGYVSMADLYQPSNNAAYRAQAQSDTGTSPEATGDSASMHSSVTSQEIHDMIVDASSPGCSPAELPPFSPSQPPLAQFPAVQTMPEESSADADSSTPKIERVVPDRGPLSGGTEVTILGKNLRSTLVTLFGDVPAYTVAIWSSSAMVVTVPPGASPGPVFLTFKDENQDFSSGLKSYVYVDDLDRRIMEMALQVVGVQMNGRQENATEIAKRIVGGTSSRQSSPADPWVGSDFITTTAASADRGGLSSTNFEGSILQLLSVLDSSLPENTSTTRLPIRDALYLKNDQQHGLLHMAAMLGFHRLTFWCLKKGGDPNIVDKYGFTPLHFAALHGRVTVTRILLESGADAHRRNMLGRTALEVAIERDQPDVANLFPPLHTVRRRSQHVQRSRRSSRSSLLSSSTRSRATHDDDEVSSETGSSSSDLSDSAVDADASEDEEERSDVESRLSRSPSTISIPASAAVGGDRTPLLPQGPPTDDVAPSQIKQGIHVDDIAKAYQGFLAKISSAMPQTPQLSQTYSLKSPFAAYAPYWAEKLPLPPQFVNVEQMKAWFHTRQTVPAAASATSPTTPATASAPTATGAVAASSAAARDSTTLATFNPPVGHFWRPFDVLRRSSFSTQQPQPHGVDGGNGEHTYPPPQTAVEMPLDMSARERLARRLGYVPQDINANVLRAVDYHRSKYGALRRRRVFFVFILPAILLALAWLFYGTNSMSLEAILRPPSFLSSSYGSPRHALPIAA